MSIERDGMEALRIVKTAGDHTDTDAVRVVQVTKNLFDPTKARRRYFVNLRGELRMTNNYEEEKTSLLILPVKYGRTYTLSGRIQWFSYGFFTTPVVRPEYLVGSVTDGMNDVMRRTTLTITPPSPEAKYLCFSGNFVADPLPNGDWQLEEGARETSYIPHTVTLWQPPEEN